MCPVDLLATTDTMLSALFGAGALALALGIQSSAASAIPDDALSLTRAVNESRTCNATYVRKPWDYLTAEERSAYLEAELCLMNSPSQLPDVSGAVNRWDDIQNVHIVNTDWIHFVGAFLPWHRYFISVHNRLLRDECGYTGSIPYWNESYAQYQGIANSSIFQADAFGGNGNNSGSSSGCGSPGKGNSNRTESTDIGIGPGSGECGGMGGGTNAGCLTDGPFMNVTLHLTTTTPEDYCISRNFDDNGFGESSSADVKKCLAYNDFSDMWDCLENGPHKSGHAGIGGLMTNVALSPGDPAFFLHHTWLDSLYARWQSRNLTYGLTAMTGTNGASRNNDPAWVDYDGDPGNVTTLNHTLYMAAVSENLTVADVMDISAWPNCAEYVYPDDDNFV